MSFFCLHKINIPFASFVDSSTLELLRAKPWGNLLTEGFLAFACSDPTVRIFLVYRASARTLTSDFVVFFKKRQSFNRVLSKHIGMCAKAYLYVYVSVYAHTDIY